MEPSRAKRIPETLRILRLLHHFPQKHLAAHLGISQTAYSKMERGLLCAEKHLPQIADLYGMPLLDLETVAPRMIVPGFSEDQPNA